VLARIGEFQAMHLAQLSTNGQRNFGRRDPARLSSKPDLPQQNGHAGRAAVEDALKTSRRDYSGHRRIQRARATEDDLAFSSILQVKAPQERPKKEQSPDAKHWRCCSALRRWQ
jgi:hypothetical protein